ncbi:transcriptional regulator [Vibrio coralliilyticus]|uniref:Transcriptional regulator n=1 Tax=Vibrio coralliilyticus TaxID=190893 RepID=A0A837G6D5_9VIBR|nr:LysR family transcriptional regulator [Vibrio coralliilyticus]KJY69513.1 transcriptional regulator [Vibrio coralliilyticus]QOU32829.1 LysR family transcriptional regulator [Vibrio coralliilyticus]
MNTTHLKALLLAIETGSISAAARKLGKKQSQVSQWISDLEIDLGVNFFDRTGNKSTLSQQGEQLLPSLTHTLAQLEKLAEKASALSAGEPTTIRIGIEHYVPEAPLLNAIQQLFLVPNLHVEIYRDEQAGLRDALLSGETDIVVQHESNQLHQADVEYTKLGHYLEGLVCHHSLALASSQPISVDALSEHKELIWGELGEDDGEGFSPDFAVINDLTMLIKLLEAGQGFAFLPLANITQQIQDGTLVRLASEFEQSDIPRRVELSWRPGLTLSKTGHQIIESLKQCHEFLA